MNKELIKNVEAEKNISFPQSVDFMLTGRCNLRCDFCFGPKHEIPPIKTNLAIDVINKLADNGVESVVFTGGEPTLVKDLPKILSFAKDRKLFTVLSTNGIPLSLNKNLLDEVVPNLDWIALPLEADNSKLNEFMRPAPDGNKADQFGSVLSLIPEIKEKYPNVKIKLGTVVTSKNINGIFGIPEMLSGFRAIPDTWKLYQISPSEYGKKNYESLRVSDEEFDKVYSNARLAALSVGIPNIVKYTNAERPGKYLFINPLGNALTIDPETNDYHMLGNFLEDFEKVKSQFGRFIDKNRLKNNFNFTYFK